MTFEDILYEDKIAVPIWAMFTASAAFKPIMAVLNGDFHGSLQTFISILPALCGAYLGYRHIQSIQAFKLEKMRAEHELERERIAVAREFGIDAKSSWVEAPAKLTEHTDTVDLS
jgi:hypothetical protein